MSYSAFTYEVPIQHITAGVLDCHLLRLFYAFEIFYDIYIC